MGEDKREVVDRTSAPSIKKKGGHTFIERATEEMKTALGCEVTDLESQQYRKSRTSPI